MAANIVVELADRFKMHPSTIQFFVGQRLKGLPPGTSISKLRETIPAAQYSQLYYNLSHVERGERLYCLAVKQLKKESDLSVLDIGSGVGGALVAFGRRGFELHGIEIDPLRRKMCEENLAYNGLSAALSSVDLCVQGMQGKTFDVLICNSVIEHVEYPIAMIKRFSELLNPGGVLVFGVANCNALGNVISDPHYGLFGLVLLGRGAAERLYERLVVQRQTYSVMEWFSMAQYTQQIRQAVGPVELAPPEDESRDMKSVPHLLARVTTKFDEVVNGKQLLQNPLERQELERAFADYLARLGRDYNEALTGNATAIKYFEDTYIRKSFHLVATRLVQQ